MQSRRKVGRGWFIELVWPSRTAPTQDAHELRWANQRSPRGDNPYTGGKLYGKMKARRASSVSWRK